MGPKTTTTTKYAFAQHPTFNKHHFRLTIHLMETDEKNQQQNDEREEEKKLEATDCIMGMMSV